MCYEVIDYANDIVRDTYRQPYHVSAGKEITTHSSSIGPAHGLSKKTKLAKGMLNQFTLTAKSRAYTQHE